MTFDACPHPDDLRAFSIGDLGTAAVQRIGEHVVHCQKCERQLQQLDLHQDDLVGGLRALSRYASDPRWDVPANVMTTAHAARGEDASVSSASVSLDPGRRYANNLEQGPCRLGRFELEAELGVGSFGYVFRARDVELDRNVAVKIQRAGTFASDEEVSRFLREARSAAALKHPSIVALYDTGRTDDGVCFLVTEYVAGQTLEARVKRSRLRYERAAELVIELANAIQYAHEQGIIHRDLKPSNIILDASEHPHIMDFGLAKRETGDISMTSDGRILGTPAYMSPEQARGESHAVDARTDIYSLGVILYELLTGERPYQGNRRLLLLQVIEDEPRPPRQLDERVPRDLETICLKAMAKSPSRRYQTAQQLKDDLCRYLRGEPIEARPVSLAERLVRWCRRYPLAASLLLAVPTGSLVGFFYLLSLSNYFVEESALHSARLEAEMMEEIHAFYSERLDQIDWKGTGIEITHEYLSHEKALPIPASFTKDAAERISKNQYGMQLELTSQYPWRNDLPPKSSFALRALETLDAAVRAGHTEMEVHEFTRVGEQPILLFAKGQRMQDSCVSCHNNHKQSPKTDWLPGELAGALIITHPLDRDIARTQAGLRGSFLFIGTLGGLLVLGTLAYAAGSRFRPPHWTIE